MENSTVLKSTPKDVFLHLFNILTFYLSVIGFITLFIQYVNALFPDSLDYYLVGIGETVRISSSIILIAVPAFLLTAWLLAKDLVLEPLKRDLKLRKWLVYFTLFVSAVTIIIDLITFVYNFLSGEITTRFFLKILVVLIIASAVFGYYMWDLKRKELVSKIPKILAIILFIAMVSSVVAGFFIIGTPFEQRNRRFDEQRIQNLQTIQSQIINYYTQKGTVPLEMKMLNDSISGFVVPVDPKNGQNFEYSMLTKNKFELCATFDSANDNLKQVGSQQYVTPYDSFNQNWYHKAQRTCFTREIDPELYKEIDYKPGKNFIQ
ncbi:MAG: hypothetical protein A2537_00185 [Candidatus Magasanikbacteria bacterium RIFOXYD2_FULL_36_9]|uniref:DUF5671 domain-containing protein n=1 Tax=Candidatus Magasanikbacteria bacterium RIFOXYD2_FULL_36_9 TaxID=1798707 RepID=A0A1F6NX84_9BACT|nr:MAG: hypothetical protein A2537_00185 [Candidatus Magasanikbacteria bacterium RIFOXYD2_FULL_36_9]